MKYKKEIRIFLAVWAFFLLGILILATIFLFNKMKNDNKMTDAQINQVGKPVIIEQNYHTTLK